MPTETKTTGVLEIAYEIGGPGDGPAVFLLHGWPDDPTTWDGVAPGLQSAGFRTIVPFMRGFGGSRFLSDETLRDGSIHAQTQDVIDLADALGVERFSIVGHDWGARNAYMLAALFPDRVKEIVTISAPWEPRGESKVPEYAQARAYWYQWFMVYDNGAERVRAMPEEFARIQWETWGPEGWFTEDEFETAAKSWRTPDWVSVTLSAYRSRWRDDEPLDPRYDDLRARIKSIETIDRPTLLLHGSEDGATLAKSSEGKDDLFTAGYERRVLDGVGHFVPREVPDIVVQAALGHLSRS